MRFGLTEYDPTPNFATWKQAQIQNNTFSEWSTVMIIKAIDQPEIVIKNKELVGSSSLDTISTERTEATLTPLFTGAYSISVDSHEAEDKYRFTLYSGNSTDNADFIESSGWLQHNSVVDSVDTFRFKTILINSNAYTVTYEVETINGYIPKEVSKYYFVVSETYLAALEGVEFKAVDDIEYCKENGCIQLYLTTTAPLSGDYVIARSDETSNFQVYEDLTYLVYSQQSFNEGLVYTDFTIESGVKYRYTLQQENAAQIRTSPIYSSQFGYHIVDFQYSYLYHNGVQLKLQFNQRMTSFKHTTLRTKQDTLGDRYPHLVQNGKAYYAEFPVTGLITYHMDSDETFFRHGPNGIYYGDDLVIPGDKFFFAPEAGEESTVDDWTIDTDLTDNNIYIERRFREKVEEFLNNFDYKLYKSPTEGNMIVTLMNVTLTPQETLGRMIYEFSATAYEVLKNTIENLNEIGIIDIGQFTSLASEDTTLSFGQIQGVYDGSAEKNIYELIRQQEEVSIGGGYKTKLEGVTSIWVEPYPIIDLTGKLLELRARRADLIDEGEPVEEIEKEIAETEALKETIESQPASFLTILNVGGNRVLLQPNKVYSVSSLINSITLVSAVSPILINYVCKLSQTEDRSVGIVSAIDATRVWGQISGVFTGTDSVLKTYNYNWRASETYRIYNNTPDALVEYDGMGRVLVDNTTFNLYHTINLYDIIEEEARRQVEYSYDKTTFHQDESGQWTDGTIYYTFGDVTVFDIECDPGTKIKIGAAADGSDANTIMVGPTGRYVLYPMTNLIRYIALEKAQYCVINYKCLTNQMRMKYIGG